jgi:DNA-directed RNA polymerase subunit beta'
LLIFIPPGDGPQGGPCRRFTEILHLDAQRPQGPGRHRVENGRLRHLSRRLCDVAQDVIVTGQDCGTGDGIDVQAIVESGEIIEPLADRIVGRVALEDLRDYEGNIIVHINQEITEDLAKAVESAGIERVKIRSVLTCEAKRGVCQLCRGRNLATGRMVERGEAVGIISAQSIGEPRTQLTMRTSA